MWSLKLGGYFSIQLGLGGSTCIRNLDGSFNWIVHVRIRVIGQSGVEIVDIIDLVTSVLDKKIPNLATDSQ